MTHEDFTADLCVICIHTIASSRAVALAPEIKAPGNYKDEAKKASYIEEKMHDFVENKAALDAITGELVAVSMLEVAAGHIAHIVNASSVLGREGGPAIDYTNGAVTFVSTEEEVLEEFVGSHGPVLAGHALHAFVLPFIMRRAALYGIELNERFRPRPRYFDMMRCFDTSKAWSCGKRDDEYEPLARIVRFFGIQGKIEIPKQMTEPETFIERFRDDPARCLSDIDFSLTLTSSVAERLYDLVGSVSAAELAIERGSVV